MIIFGIQTIHKEAMDALSLFKSPVRFFFFHLEFVYYKSSMWLWLSLKQLVHIVEYYQFKYIF